MNLASLLLLLACGDKDTTDDSVPETDTDTDTDADSDTDADADTDSDTDTDVGDHFTIGATTYLTSYPSCSSGGNGAWVMSGAGSPDGASYGGYTLIFGAEPTAAGSWNIVPQSPPPVDGEVTLMLSDTSGGSWVGASGTVQWTGDHATWSGLPIDGSSGSETSDGSVGCE